jgi:hypothetical protein
MIHTHQASDRGPGRLFLEAKMEDRRLDVLCSTSAAALNGLKMCFFPSLFLTMINSDNDIGLVRNRTFCLQLRVSNISISYH